MRKAEAFFLILLFGFTLLYAQEKEDPSEGEGEGNWDIYETGSYSHGDQTFVISLGPMFPIVFVNNGTVIKSNFDPPIGWAGSLSYNYFFTPKIFLGGELGGSFNPTLGNNMYYLILLGARTGYQFYYWRLEFPLNVTLGMTLQRYLNNRYFGLYMKGGGAVYFRYNNDWSFGLITNWYWLPQWTNESRKNVHGNMMDVLLSARYHF